MKIVIVHHSFGLLSEIAGSFCQILLPILSQFEWTYWLLSPPPPPKSSKYQGFLMISGGIEVN